MKIGKKSFYFIRDKFFKLANDPYLLKNKENGNARPCLLAAKYTNNLIWLIPISSKIEKYKTIWSKRIKEKGFCNTIVFGTLLGKDCAFLLQNMFPITEEYLLKVYRHSHNKIVKIDDKLSMEIKQKFNEVLSLVRKGRKGIVFPDVLKIEKLLLK